MPQVTIVPLERLRAEVARKTRAGFASDYPGAFLVAMGYLATETVLSVRRAAAAGAHAATAPVVFGPKLRHQPADAHPLAGGAFFLPAAADERELRLGRGATCDLVIPDVSVSEDHCCLLTTSTAVVVVDHASTNGTSINLERLAPNVPHELADQDILSLGRYSFQILSTATLFDELALLSALDEPADRT